jgi:transcriptional regulator with XRE-family HTH domain
MTIEVVRAQLDAARKTFSYRLEKVLFEVAERVCLLMDEHNMARTELAKKMAVTPAYITKLLTGNPNLTIKSLLKLADAFEHDLSIHFVPKTAVVTSMTTFALPVEPERRFVSVSSTLSARPIIAEDLDALADAA